MNFGKPLAACMLFLVVLSLAEGKDENKNQRLQIGVKRRANADSCLKKSRKGDTLHMHYTGKLEDGTEFDSSIPRGQPFVFVLGSGQVIKGWDMGLLDMCETEKRKLIIPSHLGYGDHGSPQKFQEELL